MGSNNKFVSYLRVSTQKQGRSGLGLQAQRDSVSEYLRGLPAVLLEEFLEVETGRSIDRPQLGRAMAACRVHGATLVVAKLDRLARNAHFLLGLQEAGVEFVCCDLPGANRLTVGIMAMVAEEEATLISARTRAALAAARARGVRLGRPNLTAVARRQGSKASAVVRSRRAAQRATDLMPLVAEFEGSGASGPSALAKYFNMQRVPAARGGEWSATQASRLLLRVKPARGTRKS